MAWFVTLVESLEKENPITNHIKASHLHPTAPSHIRTDRNHLSSAVGSEENQCFIFNVPNLESLALGIVGKGC